jgi:uncharacterized membrane protein
MFLLVVGIAVMINGMCDYNDWITRSLAFICLGLGLLKIFMIFREVEL